MGRGLTHISIKVSNLFLVIVVGSCAQMFLCSQRYFRTGLPAGYLFSWQRKRHSRTRTRKLDFMKERSTEAGTELNTHPNSICLGQSLSFSW